jgi:hypothetical protein
MNNLLKCTICGFSTADNLYWAINLKLGASCPSCYSGNSGKMVPVIDHTAKTQKSKGLQALDGATSLAVLRILQLSPVKEKIETTPTLQQWLKSGFGVFARPCPPTPQHGFVESRQVESEEDIEKLRLETLAANEDSEIMFTPLIKAVRNAVLVPTLLTVGPGHDGATAGKKTVSVPLAGQFAIKHDIGAKEDKTALVLKKALIGEDQDPYIEAVTESQGTIILTQLRAGPKLPVGVSADFIPAAFTVKRVRKTHNEDLLEWAKIVHKMKEDQETKPGIIVWHPGGSVTDHFSVHCRENNIPIVTTFKPKIGQVLEANSSKLADLDPDEMVRGIAAADAASLHETSNLSQSWTVLLLIALHNSSVLRGTYSFWIGAACGAICKLGLAAMEAEARHAHECYGGMKGKPDIYGYYCSKSLSFARARLNRITQILHYGFGDPKKGGSGYENSSNKKFGYGGPKWALCGAALCPLFNAIKILVEQPTADNSSRLLEALNIAVNQAHNGGWWLNKFCSPSAYDEVPKGNISWTLRAINAIAQANDTRNEKSFAKHVERFVRQVNQWPAETTISNLKWRKATIDIEAGRLRLNLKASTVPMPIIIDIAASDTLVNSLLKGGSVRIKEGKVELDLGTSTRILWEESPLTYTARPDSLKRPWG